MYEIRLTKRVAEGHTHSQIMISTINIVIDINNLNPVQLLEETCFKLLLLLIFNWQLK